MDKKRILVQQIARTNKKSYENYVVTRIVHGVDDLDVEFVTQQYVKRPDGFGFADLYIPQINLFVEVDEGHHRRKVDADEIRDVDFALATGARTKRIRVDRKRSLVQINRDTDRVVAWIQREIKKQCETGTFVPWNPMKEMDPITWIKRKRIHVDDKVAFRRSFEACRCMGLNYDGFQRGGAKHPVEPNTLIWFPKLYPNAKWDNRFDDKTGVITEKCADRKERRRHVAKWCGSPQKRRIVFARVRSNLGDVMYRFRGVFELDESASNARIGVRWKRTSKEARTYDFRS